MRFSTGVVVIEASAIRLLGLDLPSGAENKLENILRGGGQLFDDDPKTR